jgi:YfiH family protein|tara:strand:- start:107 stop:805 length:699 start_codon:yes stop_codon:yes gene_type:complete
LGGKSTGIFKSLNCGTGSSDKRTNVLKNLEIVGGIIKSKSKKIVLLNQIHSSKLRYISKSSKLKNKFKGDALITDRIGIPIAVLTADCVPILLYENNKKMIGAIHAGWKGAYKGIITKVIKFMIKKGCSPKNITAAIGPCISHNNYQVREDFIKRFIKKDEKNILFFKKAKNKNYFNLSKYVHFQLKSLNIKKIDVINKDTFNVKNNFFSARRSISRNENDYGRNISIIVIN